MYYFLAISQQRDVINGSFWPAFVLCQSYTTSEKRSGYKIIKIINGVQTRKIPRILFTEMTGHEDMINFMSSYQTQDKEKGKHYHPHGYLCWYGCKQYGEPNGFVQPIKKVPEYVWIFDFQNKGYQRLKRERKQKPSLNELLTREPQGFLYKESDVKAILSQATKFSDRKRREKDASSKKGRSKRSARKKR